MDFFYIGLGNVRFRTTCRQIERLVSDCVFYAEANRVNSLRNFLHAEKIPPHMHHMQIRFFFMHKRPPDETAHELRSREPACGFDRDSKRSGIKNRIN